MLRNEVRLMQIRNYTGSTPIRTCLFSVIVSIRRALEE